MKIFGPDTLLPPTGTKHQNCDKHRVNQKFGPIQPHLCLPLKDRLQISLQMLSGFKRINFHFPCISENL